MTRGRRAAEAAADPTDVARPARRGSRRRAGRDGEADPAGGSGPDGGAGRDGRPDAPPVPNSAVAGDHEPDPRSIARAIILRQLTMGPRSRGQLAAVLRRRGCADEVAGAVLDRMTELGLVDDAAFAEQLVQSRRRTKGLATAALRRELRDKGVADELARAALDATDPAAERARAEQLVAKKLRTMAGLDPQVQARRLAALLARKGYPADTAYPVVRDALSRPAAQACSLDD